MLSSSGRSYYHGKRADLFDFTLGLFQDYPLQAEFVLSQIKLQKSLTSLTSILEIGCGTGRLISLLAARLPDSVDLVGVDISADMVAIARTRYQSDRIRFFIQDATLFLRNSGQVFDCIIFLFNFVQGFFSLREISSFLLLVSQNLTSDGIAIFDWHNDLVFRRIYPAGIRTKLEMPLKRNQGRTICYISSSYHKQHKETSCYFRINRRNEGVTRLVTRHHLHLLTSEAVERALLRSGLARVAEVADYVGGKFDKNASERCIMAVRKMKYANYLQAIVKQRLIDVGVLPLAVAIVGSCRDMLMRPEEGDIDLLLIIPDMFLHSNKIFSEICSILVYLCNQESIHKLEFRHGPFKQTGRLQLHALLHGQSTILDIPMITRWTWYLQSGNSIALDILFREMPTKQSLLGSGEKHVQHLYRQFRGSTLEFREWSFNNQPTLRVTQMNLTSQHMTQVVFRHFILAAAWDITATCNICPNNVEWFRSILPFKAFSILRLVAQVRDHKVSYEDVDFFLKTVMLLPKESGDKIYHVAD